MSNAKNPNKATKKLNIGVKYDFATETNDALSVTHFVRVGHIDRPSSTGGRGEIQRATFGYPLTSTEETRMAKTTHTTFRSDKYSDTHFVRPPT